MADPALPLKKEAQQGDCDVSDNRDRAISMGVGSTEEASPIHPQKALLGGAKVSWAWNVGGGGRVSEPRERGEWEHKTQSPAFISVFLEWLPLQVSLPYQVLCADQCEYLPGWQMPSC